MRADQFLVHHGYFESRAKAQAAIKAGTVVVDGKTITKPSQAVIDGATVQAEPEHPWVSRGGIKLAGAFDAFDVDVSGRVCLDVGSSTGGFTDVLLSNGAMKVYAVDVGRDQLHPKLRKDQRLVSMEQTDARKLAQHMFEPIPNFLVCDASFISLAKVIARPLSLMPKGAEAILLFKPQFEVGKANIGKGGLVKDNAIVQERFKSFQNWMKDNEWDIKNTAKSPIEGGDGNTEFLIHVKK